MNIYAVLLKKFQEAMIAAGIDANYNAQMRKSTKDQFGDYQINGIIEIAKRLHLSPLILAEKVVSHLNLKEIAYKIDIKKPGFINIFLNVEWVESCLTIVSSSHRLGVGYEVPQTIVIDYSSPNIAKEMHIGHMRSTIIGDASVRTLLFLGHNVIKANHVGDWGMNFGMLIAYLKQERINHEEVNLSDLEGFYRNAKKRYNEDLNFATVSRDYVKKLQNNDKSCYEIWKKLVKITIDQNQKIYNRLNVMLDYSDIRGESAYKAMLPDIIDDLKAKEIAIEHNGATVVFLKDFKNKTGQPVGVVIKKKDGTYLYATTDIACIKYRCEFLKADRIIYYIDSRQYQHLMQIWDIAKKANYISDAVSLEYHMFGMILNKDGKPFKTRSGNTVKLVDLLDEGLSRARQLIFRKNPSINELELEKLARIISIGAIKYSDLSRSRTTSYIFDWNKMLNFEGNTALYIQYTYVRIISIFKRAGIDRRDYIGKIKLQSKQEIKLAIHLLRFEEIIVAVARNGIPHALCLYLYNLSAMFSNFYENFSILGVKDQNLKNNRLQLAILTARTLKQGLDLLGIETTEKM